MSFLQFRRKVYSHVKNIPGWRTNRKIIVFESDDWGSVRTSSLKSLKTLRSNGIDVDNCHYMQNDSLASENDLNELFSILLSHKDFKGNHPVLTANCLVTNPNFKKIEENNFENYYFESFTTTLSSYPEHRNCFSLWEEGMRLGIFHPQFHGREHLNIERWMTDLQEQNEETILGFYNGIFGISGHISKIKRGSYLAAFDGVVGQKSLYKKKDIIEEGLNLFNEHFGYRSKSFIAPNYVWNDQVEKIVNDCGVKYIQGTNTQTISSNKEKKQLKRHYLGQQNKIGQRYLIRNCFFEPSEDRNKDWVNSCLREIAISFLYNKPAVISTHRVNFVGFINPKNRSMNLPLLDYLLTSILRKWPDVEFMTSDKLGDLIAGNE